MTATDDSPAVLVEQDEGLVTITLNRPRRKNAINAAMWHELDAVVTRAETDPTVRALVLPGAAGNSPARTSQIGRPAWRGRGCPYVYVSRVAAYIKHN